VFLLRLAAGLREASVHRFFIAVPWEPGGLDIISDEKPVTPGDGRERKTESNCVPFKESNRYGGKNGFCYLELSNVVTYWSGTSSRGRHGKRGQNLGVEKVVNP
jgi:hypothetical protein